MEMKLDQQLIHIFDPNDPDDQKILEQEREAYNASRKKPEKCKTCCYSHEFGCLNEYCVKGELI